jgi:hypothetical protein
MKENNEASKLPSRLEGKVCPHIPPQPEIAFNVITKQANPAMIRDEATGLFSPKVAFSACLGVQCAIWDSCQGENSPAAIRSMIKDHAPKLEGLLKNPLISRFLGA